ncbi:hypothetical protein RE474_02050 [Methanolobus sediminis]|uniref:DUF7507 domain-containing protein n=1 Tax=Methanolobus sediminis TaxID=3072978 RepID=A0AA51YJF8_9EURY|nr:hypothetical protein [Methanolobus sediminis]WMW25525.1 hypothetical protein RE474_02050 [Methanolobus sediminis]
MNKTIKLAVAMHGRVKSSVTLLFALALIITSLAMVASAADSDISVDFVAAAPGSYNHLTGGGAYDDGTVGVNEDIVNSLEGGDYKCGDIVTFFAVVHVDNTASAQTDAPQTIEMNFSFLMDTTGQSGVAIGDVVDVHVNYGTIEDLIAGENNIDDGIYDDGGSVATLVSKTTTGPIFTAGSELWATIELTDLDANETVVVRIDTKLFCDPGSNPTGNLQADLVESWLTFINNDTAVEPPDDIAQGSGQNIPFKQTGNIGYPMISITKTVTTTDGDFPGNDSLTITYGETVKYLYVVENNGDAPLYNVNVVDDAGTSGDDTDDFAVLLLTTLLTDLDGDGTADDLAAGGSASGVHLFSPSTLGIVINTATAAGNDSIIEPTTLTATDTATVLVIGTPSIDIEKIGILDVGGDGTATPGDMINYEFNVTNNGTINLNYVNVTDILLGIYNITPTNISLDPGEYQIFTGQYDLTQADINAGWVNNTATAVGTSPQGIQVNDTDSYSIPIPQTPAIDLVKTGEFMDESGDGYGQVGENVSYTFNVTNIGTVTLYNVSVTEDMLAGMSSITPAEYASVAPGDMVTFTATYALTQADLDMGSVYNNATAEGTSPQDETVNDTDDETVLIPENPMIDLVKTGEFMDESGDGYGQVGENVSYTFNVTNIGTVTLYNVSVTEDILAGMSSITPAEYASVAPGDMVTFTATYALTQADLDMGSVYNNATAEGTSPQDETVNDTDDETVMIPENPMIDLVKTGEFMDESGDGYGQVGENVSYTFNVTNIGTVTLYNVSVTEDMLTGMSSITPAEYASVAPGDMVTFTATYALTQADLDMGSVYNNATAEGTSPQDETVNDTDDETVMIPENPMIDLVKTGEFMDESGDGYGQVGENVSYTFNVTNIGTVTLYNVSVTEDMLTGMSSITPAEYASLAPGDMVTFTATYALTQADLDMGSVYNNATAEGTSPQDETVNDTDDETVMIPENPMIDLVKTGEFMDESGDGYGQVGENVSYTFNVTNIGTVTLYNVSVTEDMLTGMSSITPAEYASLAPGDMVTFTATYALTQADLDMGSVYNNATAEGTSPQDETVNDTDDETVMIPENPMIDLVKTGEFMDESGDGYGQVGENVSYTFNVTNIGTVTLYNVSVTEDMLTGMSSITPAEYASLAPGDMVTFTATYALTQADLDMGSVYNNATAEGTSPQDETVNDTDDETVMIPENPMIDLVKTGEFMDESGDGYGQVGENVSYTFNVTNIGTVTLYNVSVTEDMLTGMSSITPAEYASLAPGDMVTFTATYALTQADLDMGSVYNNATAEGTSPQDETVNDTDDETVMIPENPMIDLVKTGEFMDESGDGYGQVGENVSYTFNVTNIGTVTLYNVSVTEDMLTGMSSITPAEYASLAPGDMVTFTATYALTQADLDMGSVYNNATAEGTSPQDETVNDTDDETVMIPENPMIDLVKTGEFMDESGDGYGQVGENVSYTFNVTNIGTVTLYNVSVTEDMLTGMSSITPAEYASVAPGDMVTFTATYALTQADLDMGSVYNNATAEGTSPQDETVNDTDDETVMIPENPMIDLVKTGEFMDESGDGYGQVGENVSYTFNVTNIGTVTLYNVSVTEDMLTGMSSITPAEYASLAPGDMVTFTATYALTQADLDMGSVYNNATAEGTSPQDETVNDTDDETVLIPENPMIDLVKTGEFMDESGDGYGQVGENVSYTFNVTNIGTVTLYNVSVTEDILAGMSSITPAEYASVAPGDMVTFTATYALTQADLDMGSVYNNATAEGTSPQDETVNDTDDETVMIPQYPHIALTKTADPIIYTYEGQVIHYTLNATNDGTVTLNGTFVTDTLLASVNAVDASFTGVLSVGQSAEFVGTYMIQAADLAGPFPNIVPNTATVTGYDPQGAPVFASASAVVTQVNATAQIAPTQTTCYDFRTGTADDLETAYYMVLKKTGEIQSVAPGVMFYYSDVTPTSDTVVIEVDQNNTAGWPDIAIQDEGQIILWDSDCLKVQNATVNMSGENPVLTVTGVTPGETYYLGVKYTLSSLQGYVPTGTPDVTYLFVMYQDGAEVISSWDGITVEYKKK